MIKRRHDKNSKTARRLLEAKKMARQVSHAVEVSIMAMRDPMDDLFSNGWSNERIAEIRFVRVFRAVIDALDFGLMKPTEIRDVCSAVALDIGYAMCIPLLFAFDTAKSVADEIIDKLTIFIND